jgi:hypothetical protein
MQPGFPNRITAPFNLGEACRLLLFLPTPSLADRPGSVKMTTGLDAVVDVRVTRPGESVYGLFKECGTMYVPPRLCYSCMHITDLVEQQEHSFME